MQFKEKNLCDLCFSQCEPGKACPVCGYTKETYKSPAGLLPPGTNLMGKYIIGLSLERDKVGATYLAFSGVQSKPVVIKEFLPLNIVQRRAGGEEISITSEKDREAFEEGAKAFYEKAETLSKFAKLRNVVSVYEFFTANGTSYYSMEYLQGTDLREYVARKGGKLSEREVIEKMRELSKALSGVHKADAVLRNISPDSIFICNNGDVKVIDCGVADGVVASDGGKQTSDIKREFAPAEQYIPNSKQGAPTDIYSLGATMYFALTGKPPASAMERIGASKIQIGGISEGLSRIITKCLENKQSDRYQSADELMHDLDALGSGIKAPVYVAKDGAEFDSMPRRTSAKAAVAGTEFASVPRRSSRRAGAAEATAQNIRAAQAQSTPQSSGRVKAQKQKGSNKKNTPIYIGLAACIVLFIAIGIFALTDDKKSDDTASVSGGGYQSDVDIGWKPTPTPTPEPTPAPQVKTESKDKKKTSDSSGKKTSGSTSSKTSGSSGSSTSTGSSGGSGGSSGSSTSTGSSGGSGGSSDSSTSTGSSGSSTSSSSSGSTTTTASSGGTSGGTNGSKSNSNGGIQDSP